MPYPKIVALFIACCTPCPVFFRQRNNKSQDNDLQLQIA